MDSSRFPPEGIKEEGYDGSHVRLLVCSFNVGNSPLTDLAPWLPYGGKGYDLIVVGLQESTYRPPRGGRDSPRHGSSLSPTNGFTPPQGVSPRWAAMQAGEMNDSSSPGVYLSPVSSPPTTPHETPQKGVHNQRESTGCAKGVGAKSDRRSVSSRLRSLLSPVVLDKLFWSPSRESSPRVPHDGKGEQCINDVAGGGDVEGVEQLKDLESGGERKHLYVASTGDVNGTGKENVSAESSPNVARKEIKALDISLCERISIDRSETDPSTGDHLAAISPSLTKDSPRRTVFWRDTSTGKESSTSIAGGKDMSRLDRARKVLKQRRKEMNAGAMHLRSMLSGHLGPDFEQVISLRRMQMRVKIFLRRSLLHDYDRNEGESAAENTGIAGVVANKGGLVCKLRLKGTTLCFVSCHLEAHEGQNHLSRRNASCAEILQGARLGDRRMIDVDSQFHHVFWLGDMNYRTNFGLSPIEQHRHVMQLVKEKDWMSLWKGDELMEEMKNRRVLTGFETEPPVFAPTFKTLRGEEKGYNPQRVPSYTDRILWKSLPGHSQNLGIVNFRSFPEITSSDHKPVHASFDIKLTPEMAVPAPGKKKRLFQRARIPAALEVARGRQTQLVRLVFEDLQAIGLPPVAGGGRRNPFIAISTDPKHLLTESKKTINPRWGRKCTCHLAISDPALLKYCHVSLMVMNRERGSKDDVIGVANLSLAEMVWSGNLRPTSNSTTALNPRSTFTATRLRSMPLLYRSSSSPPSYQTKSPPQAVRGNSTIFAGIDYDVVEDFDDDDEDDDVTDNGYDDDDEEEINTPRGETAAIKPGFRSSGGSGSIVQPQRCQGLSSQDSDGMPPPHLPRLQFRNKQLKRVRRRGRTLSRHKSDGWLLQQIFSRGSFRRNDAVFPARVKVSSGRKLSEPTRHGIGGHRIDTGSGLEREWPCLTPVRGKEADIGGGGLAVSNARRNNQQANPFFHSHECRKTAERGDEGEAQDDAQRFDVMLVGNGLPRGRISGRCYLSMGSGAGNGGGSYRRPSMSFYGGGTVGTDGGTGGDGKTNGHSGVEGLRDVSDQRLFSSGGKKGGLRWLLSKLRGWKGIKNRSGRGGSRAVASGATEREYESAAVRSGNHGSAVSLIVAPGKASRVSSVNGNSASRRPSSASVAAAAAATAAGAAKGVRRAGHPAGCSLM